MTEEQTIQEVVDALDRNAEAAKAAHRYYLFLLEGDFAEFAGDPQGYQCFSRGDYYRLCDAERDLGPLRSEEIKAEVEWEFAAHIDPEIWRIFKSGTAAEKAALQKKLRRKYARIVKSAEAEAKDWAKVRERVRAVTARRPQGI